MYVIRQCKLMTTEKQYQRMLVTLSAQQTAYQVQFSVPPEMVRIG